MNGCKDGGPGQNAKAESKSIYHLSFQICHLSSPEIIWAPRQRRSFRSSLAPLQPVLGFSMTNEKFEMIDDKCFQFPRAACPCSCFLLLITATLLCDKRSRPAFPTVQGGTFGWRRSSNMFGSFAPGLKTACSSLCASSRTALSPSCRSRPPTECSSYRLNCVQLFSLPFASLFDLLAPRICLHLLTRRNEPNRATQGEKSFAEIEVLPTRYRRGGMTSSPQ